MHPRARGVNSKMSAETPDAASRVESLLRFLERLPESSSETIPQGRVKEVGDTVAQMFAHSLADEQTAALLTCLHTTGVEQQPEVLKECAGVMRKAAEHVDTDGLGKLIKSKQIRIGTYDGGPVRAMFRVLYPYII